MNANKYMLHIKVMLVMVIVTFVVGCTKEARDQSNPHGINLMKDSENASFYMDMKSIPFMPANTSNRDIACKMPSVISVQHATSEQINYSDLGWEQRIPLDVELLKDTKTLGRIAVIDIIYTETGPAYRYFSNDTHHEVYEPWSSSKVFAYTGAIAKMREKGVGAPGMIGKTNVSDMITSIHSYQDYGSVQSTSNELATYFANIAGRDYLTSLFYENWLKLSTDNVFFRGAYGPSSFAPESNVWTDKQNGASANIESIVAASDDPGYLPYRCEKCGLTGNKPMSTLSQVEWIKRLALHEKSPSTAHPNLTADDVNSLFYGYGNSHGNDKMAGMIQGISMMLHHSLAQQINDLKDPKTALDDFSNGKWRIFQKIGWGPSETRGTTENVVLAHVCLPNESQPEKSIQFSIAAQVAIEQNLEENVPVAGMKMQALLDAALSRFISTKGL